MAPNRVGALNDAELSHPISFGEDVRRTGYFASAKDRSVRVRDGPVNGCLHGDDRGALMEFCGELVCFSCALRDPTTA